MTSSFGKLHLCALALALTAHAQSQAAPNFEAASIRVAGREPPRRPIPARGDILGGPGTDDPGRLTYTWVTMSSILFEAFGFSGDRILNVPEWAGSERFNLRAIVPAGATKEQVQQMMQGLLKERFHLAFHRDQKQFDSCDLIVAKGGPKLKEAAPADGATPRVRQAPAVLDRDGFPILPPGYADGQAVASDGVMRGTYRMESINALQFMLAFGRTGCSKIVDKTGLTGKYDFQLEYAASPAPRPADQAGLPSDPAPEFATAVEQQLGLKLVKSPVKLDVVVIDHLDRQPAEN